MQPPSLYLFFLHLYISISTSGLSLTVYFHLYVLYISFLISWSASVFLHMSFWKSPSVHLFLYIASIYPIQYISNVLCVYPSEYIFLYISVCMCLSEYLKCVQYISICYLHVYVSTFSIYLCQNVSICIHHYYISLCISPSCKSSLSIHLGLFKILRSLQREHSQYDFLQKVDIMLINYGVPPNHFCQRFNTTLVYQLP